MAEEEKVKEYFVISLKKEISLGENAQIQHNFRWKKIWSFRWFKSTKWLD